MPKLDIPEFCDQRQHRQTGEPVIKVIWPHTLGFGPEGGAVVDFLDGLRRTAILEHEQLTAAQRECGKERNVEAAREYRGLVASAMKRLRAIRLWLGHYSGGFGGDCPWIEFWDWPPDLGPEIHEVAREIELAAV